jgi:hypothetical protein
MRLLLKFMCLGALLAQDLPLPSTFPPKEETDRKLPSGKSQTDEILKADYQRSLKDAADLVELSQALQKQLQDSDSHVLSLDSLKKTVEIEKLAKRLHGRLLRF